MKNDIIVHNHSFEIIQEHKYESTVKRVRKDLTKDKHPLHIQFVDGHYVAMVKKDKDEENVEIQTKEDPKEKEKDRKEETEETEDTEENVHIQRPESDGPIRVFKRKNVKLDDKIAAWDIEATNDNRGIQTPYSCGIVWKKREKETDKTDKKEEPEEKKEKLLAASTYGFWGKNKPDKPKEPEQQYKAFEGLNCIPEYFEFLFENRDAFDGFTFYAHNSGKYDTLHLIRSYLLNNTDKFKIDPKRSCCSNGRWLRLVVKTKDNKILRFQDSYAIITMPLKKACIEYDVEHQKLDETVHHDEINLDNWHTFKALPKYLENDCRGLYEVIEKYTKDIFEVSRGKINITNCLSSATFAKHNYFQNYYEPYKFVKDENGKTIKIEHWPIFKESKKDDAFIRESYFGGRCEIFVKPGTNVKIVYYFDFTSLYPSESRKNLPYGRPERVTFDSDDLSDLSDFFGFVRCMVRTINEDRKPIHGIKDPQTGRLKFPYFPEWTEITLFSEEIKLGLKHQIYEYKFIEGIKYKAAPILAKCMEDAVKLKAKARAEGKDGQAGVAKTIANSSYGFWALNTHDRQGIVLGKHEEVDVMKYLENDKLIDMSQVGDYTMLRVLQDIDVKETAVSIAAAITSWSRMRLWELIDAVEMKGHKVYMCDTDSVVTSCNIHDYPDLMKEFCPDGTGKELGSLKDESEEAIEKHFTKKIRKQNNYKDTQKTSKEHKKEIKDLCELQTTRHFDSAVFAGLKFYSLQKKLHNGEVIEINKLKGGNASKLCHEDYLDNTEINQVTTQFKCGVQGYMDEQNPFAIRVRNDLEKNFKYSYTKAEAQPDTYMLKPLNFYTPLPKEISCH